MTSGTLWILLGVSKSDFKRSGTEAGKSNVSYVYQVGIHFEYS